MPLDLTTLRRAQKYRQARRQEDLEVAEHLEEASTQSIEARTHRAFVADLPRLACSAGDVPTNARAEALARALANARAINERLVDALAAIVAETMDYPPARPISTHSWLPKQLLEQAQRAIEAATGERVPEVRP